MKRLLYLFPVLLLSLVSCKRFLDTHPTDSEAPQYYYNTEAELNTALIGVYDPLSTLQLYGQAMFYSLNSCTDESYFYRNTQTTGPMVYNYDFGDADITQFWGTLYQGIERANLLIQNINKPVMDSVKRAAILGQALFLRGEYYFELVKNYGDVPLKIVPTPSVNNPNIARRPSKDVYAQILKDMTAAEAILPSASSFGTSSRVSKTTAEGILARVCLTMAGYPLHDATKYAESLIWAQKVVASGEHALREIYNTAITNSAYSQIFINQSQDIYDIKESMWEAEFSGNGTDAYVESGRVGSFMGITFQPSANYQDTGYSYGFINGTERLYRLYGAGDQRRDWAIAPYIYNNSTFARVPYAATEIYKRNVGKWRRSYEILKPKGKNATPTNFPILRYADVLLMLAEAENQVNGPSLTAYDAINKVRRRGYGVPVNAPSVVADLAPGMSKDQFQQAVQDERSRELCFEALRRNDLIRWGIFVETMHSVGNEIAVNGAASGVAYAGQGGKNVSERHLLFPIPSGEFSVNNLMTQNPGW